MKGNLGVLGLGVYGTLFGFSLLLSWLFPELFGWRWIGRLGSGTEVGMGVLLGLLTALVTYGVVRFSRRGYWLSRRLALATRELPTWSLAPLALAAGLAEEAWFRGTLWSPIVEALGPELGPPLAWVFTSILFGWAHGAGKSGFRTWTLFALVTGMVLGAMRWWTDGLIGAMVAHALVDLINLPALRFRQQPLEEE